MTVRIRGLRPLAVVAASVLALAGCTTAPRGASTEHVYPHGAVAADHEAASAAGAAMLRRGGNAVDAAVAASFCLSVVRPYSCGIGGGGFMVICPPEGSGAAVALNYRETAPAAVGPGYYRDRPDGASRFGVDAVGVPGTVAGLLTALERYGTLDRATVLAPAIAAAEQGFTVDAHYVDAVAATEETLRARPELAGAARFIRDHLGRRGTLRAGDRLTNPAQARALRLIAERGRDAFYRGPIADAIVAVMRRDGGPITAADLAAYRVEETAPLRGRFRRYELVTMPPPSSGGVAILQTLGILDRLGLDPARTPHNGAEYVHLVTEALKHAFADRAEWLADPRFVDVPVSRLLDDAYLDARAAAVRSGGPRDPYTYGSVTPAPVDGGTSHVSVVDGRGMAVACTETINLRFGSLVAVEDFGFALNDEMDDFTTIPGAPNAFGLRQSDRNLPAPGKRPLSSMSPTIVLEVGRPRLVAGASGGPRIITGTLECILGAMLYDLTPREAVIRPRFHHQWLPDILQFEDRWQDTAVVDALRARGHTTGWRDTVGEVQMVGVRADGVHAASDPRKGGVPAGY